MILFTIIGAGNMGSAIAKKLLSSNFCTPENIAISDHSEEKLEYFERLGCPTSTDSSCFIPDSQFIILAIKPQILRSFLSNVQHLFSSETVLCSIAAGVNENDLYENSGCEKIIRIMPNTPLLVSEGVCGLYANNKVSSDEKNIIHRMLNCFGLVVECENEDLIDSITALSGSGPAYYLYVMEEMQKKAMRFGFSKEIAKEIALQTLRGAGALSYHSEENFEVLRKNITSKGGTTEAALHFFQENKLGNIWQEGINAAYKKSKELASTNSVSGKN